MPPSPRWLIEVWAGNTLLDKFYGESTTFEGRPIETEWEALERAKLRFRGIGGFGRIAEMGPLKFKATKVKADDRQARQHAKKKVPTAARAGRRDAEIWMQETPEEDWADAIKPGVLGADEALINALGTAEAAKYLGISSPYRNGNITDATMKAFEEYSRAWAKRVSEELRSEQASTRHHATKTSPKTTKKSPAQLDAEIAEALAQYRRGDVDLHTMGTSIASNLNVGQLFDHIGHIYEITKIGRDKNRTVSIARRIRDLFNKESLIDQRSFPARDFERQHLRPIDQQTAEKRGWPPLVR